MKQTSINQKRRFNKILLALAIVATCLTAYASISASNAAWNDPNRVVINGFSLMKINDSDMDLTGYIGEGGDIAIPNDVVRISRGAFKNNLTVTGVTIPGSVKTIGDYVFTGCKNLANVTIQDGVAELGESMFTDCSSLKSVSIPASVTRIKSWAFGR